ncbi:MAG: methyltransferase [Kiritimatiellaeota bacterium]|nr:methyltransferase [Kiritimatiellota bacterium]
MRKNWTAKNILQLIEQFQPACVLAAAADLEVFDVLARRPQSAAGVARKLGADARGTVVLLDALAALQLLGKRNGRYAVHGSVAAVLTRTGPRSMLAMVQHRANCLRRWAHLAGTVKTGRPAERRPSVRGAAADLAAFIGAMDNVSAPVADRVIAPLRRIPFRRLLDVGGASGTWTAAFLRLRPGATALLFDLPDVSPLARQRLRAARCLERVTLVAGDYERHALPPGADLAWVSAIIHQNSRAQNRRLFARIRRALAPGGRIAIRDIIMAPDRTAPTAGALFAVNMLVGTAAGGTYTLREVCADLAAAGFTGARLVRRDAGMHSLVVARKAD